MTPKEKAKDLMEKMNVIHYQKLGGKNSHSKGLPVSMHKSQIKQCAITAVNEIIKTEPSLLFWQEVKQELTNEQ